MSEIEDLKKSTDAALREQRLKELLAHLTKLGEDVDKALKQDRWGSLAWIIGWGIWVGTSFIDWYFKTDDLFYKIGVIIYMAGWMISMQFDRNSTRAIAKYMATLKVLEILGIIDPRPEGGVKNKKKRLQAMIDMVKNWASSKKKAQEEVYQPA